MSEAGPAFFSPDGTYRYLLTRHWTPGMPTLGVIGLNPSTADETSLDPTLRRIVGFAKSYGFGGFAMANLFAFRATNPIDMKQAAEPVGDENDIYLAQMAQNAPVVVAAWGANGSLYDRDRDVMQILTSHGCYPFCWGTTRAGLPCHPLYLPKTTRLEPYLGRPE